MSELSEQDRLNKELFLVAIGEKVSQQSPAEKISHLVSLGADPNAVVDGYPIVHRAIDYAGNVVCLDALLRNGADPDQRDKHGRTPLMNAAYSELKNGMWGLCLINHGADIDAIDKRGRTALHLTVLSHDMESAKMLVDQGAAMVEDRDGKDPLALARRFDNQEMIDFFEQVVAERSLDKHAPALSSASTIRGQGL